MELKQVHKYIERYLEGKTSLAEEQALFTYFSLPNVDETVAPYKPYFTAIKQQRNLRFSANFNPIKKTRKVQLKRFAAVAAAVIAGVFVFQQTTRTPKLIAEEIAFQEFKTNMYLVAEQLNKGKQGVAYMKTFNQTTDKYLQTE